jgi:hypothetical protein
MRRVTRIISGGQSGVDRAALDFAIARGLEYGGWCPRGGWAEDFPDPPGLLSRYPALRETPDSDPKQRTEWNVRDADGTLILTRSAGASPGTQFAIGIAEHYAKPSLIVDVDAPSAAEQILTWLDDNPEIRVLSIGGPRESEVPGIYRAAYAALERLAGSVA